MLVAGKVFRVSGPVVEVEGVRGVRMLDMVEVGREHLIGEVVRLKGEHAFVQVYEDTTSLKAGDPVYSTDAPLSVELGPGLIGTIYDGIQRPLEVIYEQEGIFIQRGMRTRPLSREKKWSFLPKRKSGDRISGGEVIGEVQETSLILHKVLCPPEVRGTLIWVADAGEYHIDEKIAVVEEAGESREVFLHQRWPVRNPRPIKAKRPIEVPLLTGQRIIDTLFPVAKGGCVAVPGGFGTGKTVTQHQIAKWSDADVVVFVGCGERGNEMTDVLMNFAKLIDPRTQKPLLERTIFIANTSNMPVAAREASIYTGITLAEYYRDMGYHVALMGDSTSRWAEALRELSGRLEEMPLEEGFPAYLPSRLAAFYERAGNAETMSGERGSITIIASVSPPGGDFSEPVTSHTKRFVRCFWALDKDLANARHYPAISWTSSYSEYIDDIKGWWFAHVDREWVALRYLVMDLFQQEERLSQVVKLVGPDVLPQKQRLVLETCALFKNAFLQQSAYDAVDTYASPKKQFLMLKTILEFYQQAGKLVQQGISIEELRILPVYKDMIRMRFKYTEEMLEELARLPQRVRQSLEELSF
ncbi:MAG: V-type ATP synthase subunit A [Candidatus Omnitrophica bacterium]|nr:V-type ATP synthase subunit A [Candidatus Omnitrophota bacterium]